MSQMNLNINKKVENLFIFVLINQTVYDLKLDNLIDWYCFWRC